MARAREHFVMVGRTDFPHEQAGLDFVREHLPETLHARALIDLFEPSSGRHYEIDFVVIGHSAVYVVEMKDYGGRVSGDEHEWELLRPGDKRPVLRDNPLALTNQKCKVLRSKLDEYFRRHHPRLRVPFVQPLVFLSNEQVDPRLTPAGNTAVVTRETLIAALHKGTYPGGKQERAPINGPTALALIDALDGIGLRPRKTQLTVGRYRLGPVLGEGPAHQDREAQHETIETMRARARVYLVPQHTTVEERDRLRRAAKRESKLLVDVHGHPSILKVLDFVDDAPLGPTLLLEEFPGGIPLDRFLEREDPTFDERVAIFRELGKALAHCHRREVCHGGMHPGAVLVRRGEAGLELRLFDFQLGSGRTTSLTLHRSQLASESALAYQAPELALDPHAISLRSDCFSLGAIGYLLFTNHAPAGDQKSARARLELVGCFDPAPVVDDLPPAVIETIRLATTKAPHERLDDAAFIVENLVVDLARASELAQPESTAHVLVAKDGDILAERFEVKKVLGYGASARVVRVVDAHDRREYALKIALEPGQNERLREEALALEHLDHPRIVRKHDLDVLDDRVYLQLSLAGDETLHEQLAREGSLNYDMALRYGEDLLEALEHCEEKGLLHRDIKPANLGVGSSTSKSNHLTLFDFSLAAMPDDELGVGTPPYRDPHLFERKRWDAAADRWSAAITMHEMLTGVRPSLDAQNNPRLAAERFDAKARDNLREFFAKAFAPRSDDRFDSARAMRRAWSACELGPRVAATSPSPAHASDERPSDAEIAKITGRTPISGLPLSVRAINALDRAGLVHAEDLLALPNNRLSAIRGVGSKVAAAILDLRERVRARLAVTEELPVFMPGLVASERPLDQLGLPSTLLDALVDAGFHTSGAVARAPAHQVEALLVRVGVEPERLRTLVDSEQASDGSAPPTTLERWIAALELEGKAKPEQRIRRLFGLEGAELGRLDVTLRDLDPAAKRNYADAIKRWRAQPWAPTLRSLAREVVAGQAGVTPLPLAAEALLAGLPHDGEGPLALARAAALLRVAVELAADDEREPLILHRRTRGRPGHERPLLWLVTRPDLWPMIDNLGRHADELAKREVLAASSETERALELVVQNTSLSSRELGLPRLVELAAWASRHAAASSRLELYPLGMPAARALELSAQALGKELDLHELERRVHGRYPAAERLPTRPELDALLAPLQLTWVEGPGGGSYKRPAAPSTPTSVISSRLELGTSLHARPLVLQERELVAREFEQDLRALVEDRKLRVLGVNAAYVPEVIEGLEQIMATKAIALDKRLIAAIQSFMRSKGAPLELLRQTDAQGPSAGAWPNLQQVAKLAAAELATQLLPNPAPLLLVQPGLLARYDLRELIASISAAASDDRCHAVVLLNALHEGERPELIANRLTIPNLLPGQVAQIPRDWIRNLQQRSAQAS